MILARKLRIEVEAKEKRLRELKEKEKRLRDLEDEEKLREVIREEVRNELARAVKDAYEAGFREGSARAAGNGSDATSVGDNDQSK